MKLDRSFYRRETLTVAKELLGKVIVSCKDDTYVSGRIVETEAYIGPDDAAAHTFGGKRTERTQVAYRQGGFLYVYLIYGMYHCINIVTNIENKPEVVLIRALEPLDGISIMKKRRNTEKVEKLCSGPGKVCQALNVTRAENGVDLCGDTVFLIDDNYEIRDSLITATKRINIDYSGEARDYLWRFIIKDSRFLSNVGTKSKCLV